MEAVLTSAAASGQAISRIAIVLDEEPELAEGLSDNDLFVARRALRARVLDVPRGPWEPPRLKDAAFGLLVLRGLFLRRVRVATVSSVELLGPGDVLRPWEKPFGLGVVPAVDDWRVVAPAEAAVLDERFHGLMCRWPAVGLAFSNRLLRRARNLAYVMAVSHFTRVDDRLLFALWHLADKWGRVTHEGTVVPFRLTHDMLAEIIGARRPSVSTAVSKLERAGKLTRRPDRCYVLLGDPPDLATEHPQTVEVDT
jgi:CRP/FNR family cyclic AMP-dependent transcriptional regulator